MGQEFSWEDRVRKNSFGMTLLEILIGMLILGLVTGGIFTAFVFGRRVNIRSETELAGYASVQAVMEQVRLSVGGTSPGGLPQTSPGVYVDTRMVDTARPPGATAISALDLPADFSAKYQTNQGRTPAATWPDHADGMVMVVEKADENANGIADEDLDGDGKVGLDFNPPATPPGKTDLYRVRIYLRKTTPTTK